MWEGTESLAVAEGSTSGWWLQSHSLRERCSLSELHHGVAKTQHSYLTAGTGCWRFSGPSTPPGETPALEIVFSFGLATLAGLVSNLNATDPRG